VQKYIMSNGNENKEQSKSGVVKKYDGKRYTDIYLVILWFLLLS